MRFVRQDAFFGATAARALLPSELFNPGPFGQRRGLPFGLDFIEQKLAGDHSVQALMACRLALDLKAGGSMKEHDARGGLVHILAPMATGPDEVLLDVAVLNTKREHAPRELGFLFRVGGERAHV